MEDNWTPPSDAEVTDWTPPSDAQVIDEPVKKKVTPSPLQTQSSSNGLNLLSGVIPSGKALLTGQKEESAPTEQKQIDLTNAPIAEDESTRTDKFIRKPIDKKKVDEIYTLSKQNESLVDEFAKSHFVLDNLSQTEAIKQLNDLYAKREQAKDPQTAQAIDNQIEVIKSQPVEKQPSIQEAVLQNAQKYGSQPQDFNRPEIPMNPLTPNQILERNGMKTANTVGELHDRYIESATKLNELRPELDKTAAELDAFKKDARTADFKTDKSGNKTLEGLADIPEAFGHGFGGTMKSIEQGFVNLLGDKQDRIDYAKKRYLEDNILYPTRTKGMATSGSEMIGGVAPYVISTAVLPETALLGHIITNGLTMGVSGYGNGYYEMFAKQKQQGVSDEEADAIAMQNAKFEGAKETAIGASLPFMGGAGSKLFLAPAEKSAMKQFLATQGVIIPTFTAGKLASNVYQKYGLGEKDVNLGDGLAETAENGLILGAMMEFAHKAPPKLKELYRANLSEQYPSIQQSVDKAVKDGVMDASQGYAFTEKLKRDFAVFNAMPKDITTEQKLAIEPEVKQIIELSSREPSAVESPEVTKDKIVQLQKQVAEKLGTPLTEKEQKAYEKLLERQKPIKSESGKEITLELFPSEKAELNHYEKRIETANENEAKLAEEKKVAEAETPTNVGVEEGSVGVGGDVDAKLKELNKQEEIALNRPYKQLTNDAEKTIEYNRVSGDFPKVRELVNKYIDWRKKFDNATRDEQDNLISEGVDIKSEMDKLTAISDRFADRIDTDIYKNDKYDYEGVRNKYLDEYSEQNRHENKVKQEFSEKRKAVEQSLKETTKAELSITPIEEVKGKELGSGGVGDVGESIKAGIVGVGGDKDWNGRDIIEVNGVRAIRNDRGKLERVQDDISDNMSKTDKEAEGYILEASDKSYEELDKYVKEYERLLLSYEDWAKNGVDAEMNSASVKALYADAATAVKKALPTLRKMLSEKKIENDIWEKKYELERTVEKAEIKRGSIDAAKKEGSKRFNKADAKQKTAMLKDIKEHIERSSDINDLTAAKEFLSENKLLPESVKKATEQINKIVLEGKNAEKELSKLKSEQSLKETTKAETPTKNVGVEEGSGGVGGDKSILNSDTNLNGAKETVLRNGVESTQIDKPNNIKVEDNSQRWWIYHNAITGEKIIHSEYGWDYDLEGNRLSIDYNKKVLDNNSLFKKEEPKSNLLDAVLKKERGWESRVTESKDLAQLESIEKELQTNEKLKQAFGFNGKVYDQTGKDFYSRLNYLRSHPGKVVSENVSVKEPLVNEKLRTAISEGRMTATDAVKIIESAGLEVPKDILEKSLKETTKAETPTETIQEKGIEEAGSVGGGRDKSDADIEKRMAELEGAKIGTPELAEFNALEKEMEKRERDTVFNVPLENVNDAVDTLMKKEKEQPNGYGSFIEKRDARETKEVADRYLNAKDLTDAELKQDFSDAVRGNPTTWYADGLKMREALKEATNRGIDTRDMLAEVTKVYEDAGYDTETAKSVVAGMIKPILVKSQKMDKSATTETGKSGSGDIEIAKRVNNLGEFDNEIRGVTNQRRIPNEIKERYIEALRTLAINKEIGIDHPQAKRYESVYDILDANEKKKEPNKKFNKEDTFSEKSKSYFTPHELIPNVGESFDDAQKRAEKHFGMKSPYPIELIKEAKEIFSGFSYASEGFNDYVYERMQESTKKTTEPSLSQKENKLVTEEIKTAIDNGEITREQVDGFTEQDESAIEDIERKAESENEAELNSAIDQADKLIGEAVTRSEGKTESSNEKVEGGEVKKTLVTKRAYEGSFREGVKKELEAIGLTRETENFDKAEVEAKRFFDEYGEDVAIEAMKAKDIEGALGAFVWNEITKSIDKKLSESTDIAEIEQLQKKQAEMLDIWGKQQRSGGAFNAAMAKIYENSDLGYSYEKQKDKWEGKFGEPMPKDIAEKFKQYDTELSDLKKRITEAEKKVKEAEEKQAFDNIVAEVRQKPKAERSGKRKIAEGLDELTNALGVKLSAVGDKKASATKALIKIGEGLIEEGIATAKNVAEKIREYVEDKFKGKIDIKEYEPDVLKHFEETLPKITERNGKIHIPNKLIKELVKNGAETIEDLVSQVKEIAKADFPDITDREIRNSIVEYGKTQEPTKNDLLLKISRMKRIGRLISQLEDVRSGIRPLKSGLQRDEIQPRERELNKQLREEMRNLPMDEETLAGQIRTVLDARTKGIENRIEDLQREIDKGEKIPKNQRTIEDNQKVKDLREQLEKVKAEHQEKFAEQNEAEKEAKRLSMAKKNTQKRIEDLSTRLREGNFSKVEKKELKEDSELTKLRAEKIRIQEEFDKEFHKQELLNKKGAEKLKDRLWEVWSLPRVLMATGEMSFVGVQGLINTIAHPIESAKGLKRAFEFAFSEKKTEQWLNEIKSQDYYPIMKKSKLSLTEPNAELTAREELFYSGWTNMIWDALGKPLKLKSDSAHERWKELNPMRGVERASVGYLDTQRVSRFLDGMEMLKQKGITYEENPQAYKDVADVVNTFTGRASLGKLEMIAPTLSKIFFSPRNWASALKTATPYALYHFGKMRADADGFKPSTAQKMVISDLSKFVGFTTSMVMMAAAILNNDDDESTGVEFDPRSSDFMKIKIGDIRIDPWGGKIQQIIFSSRVLMDALHGVSPSLSEGGYKKKDEVMPLGVKYKSPTLASLSATQATNKLAPTMALLNRYASTEIGKDGKRKDAFGNEFELSDEAVKMLKPIYWGTVGELLKEDPSALNGLLAFYAFFGGGVNIYGKKKEKKKD